MDDRQTRPGVEEIDWIDRYISSSFPTGDGPQHQPSCVIVIDVTHDTTTTTICQVKKGTIMIGKGPVITKSAPIHIRMRQLLEAAAQDLQAQFAVVWKETGTDADAFAYHGGAIDHVAAAGRRMIVTFGVQTFWVATVDRACECG